MISVLRRKLELELDDPQLLRRALGDKWAADPDDRDLRAPASPHIDRIGSFAATSSYPATARGIDLGLDVAPAQATGHEWLLRELLANLVDNAIKYSGAGGSATIRCGRRDGAPFLEVEDDGPGVPEAELPRVLERFYRVQGTQGEGSGLGLASVYGSVRQSGGFITVDSSRRRGPRIAMTTVEPCSSRLGHWAA